MKQNYKIFLCALLLVGATGMMTAGAQGSGKPTLAVFVVGMQTDALGNSLATQIGSELNRNSRYTVATNDAAVQAKLAALRTQGASSIDRNALAEWGRDNGISTICLVADAIKGNDHMFYALLIDAKDSKVNGRGSYTRTSVSTGDVTRVALALSKQLMGPGRRHSAPAPAGSLPAELDIEMVFVEGATSVTLGYRSTDGSSSINNVKAAYTASVPSFKIGKYEVTQAQWRAVMVGTKFENYFYWGGSRGVANGALNSANCGNVACDDQRPVEYATWYLALAFCNRLSSLTGKTAAYSGVDLANIGDDGNCTACSSVTVNANATGYRLPTSNEWEYAARGCKAGVCENFMYSGSNDIGEVAWSAENPSAAYSKATTHPVGQLKPNGLGIYDMSGNVSEWCWDIWDSGTNCECRSGNWSDPIANGYVRIIARWNYLPTGRNPILGFRVVLP
jgi:formylglycine-generating enzyme required for sulfatase activity